MKRRAFGWLLFLAPFFYLTYGAANAITARRGHVSSVVFGWERGIPFVAWTIVPYWSLDLFYAASVFVCTTRTELHTHVKRLITAQLIAAACFVLFPLRFAFHAPAVSGVPAVLFAMLRSIDQPFNQAPSLHIALLVILWPVYAGHLPRPARWLLDAWFTAIGVSVLTTYQHHFFDVPTGVLLGVGCLWLWPQHGRTPIGVITVRPDSRRLIVSARYLAGACTVAAFASWIGGVALWLWWPAVSLLLVAANYAVLGPDGFQKDAAGRMSLPARLLFAPYLAAAFVNSRLWTWTEPSPVAIGGGVWLGRMPRARDAVGFAMVIDVCAELPGGPTGGRWICVPMLDRVAPDPMQLREAAAEIERWRHAGPVLVCCALGYARSAATAATWLVASRSACSVADAIDQIRRVRPRIAIDPALRQSIVIATREPAWPIFSRRAVARSIRRAG